ncbi:MAG: hypothetical protein O2819_07280 [Planctomycetota bacterium]|nr:hypothetical protein [Planctomycetota bacterium]MDA1106288.1 hypothetical protein [Planctomycetota bacterium]
MLQQTQVSRAVERFETFMRLFPSPNRMANGTESAVVRAWSGLGYYRRARSLHRLARVLRDEYGGRVPMSMEALLALPGVGRYTAGAILSIVGGQTEPIVDGNVARVILRVLGDERPLDQAPVPELLWEWAGEFVSAARSPAVANEGLMELGAMVCTPRGPKCGECPVAKSCRARARGLTEVIPAKSRRVHRREEHWHALACVNRGRLLLAKRPDGELWGGMLLVPMLRVTGSTRRPFGDAAERAAQVTFDTSACRLHISVWRSDSRGAAAIGKRRSGAATSWVSRASSPEVRVGVTARILEAAGV